MASRGVFSFFSTARPGLVGLLGAMAIVVDEGAETAEGAMVAGVDCVCSIECGIEKRVALYDLWRAEEQAR
jgi:hypothetical protein